MEFMNKSCWRQALAASLASAHTNFARDYRLIEAQFLQQVIGLMYSLHQETLLKAKTDPVSIGELIWNNTNQMFTEFIVDEPMSLAELHSKLARQTHTILALSLNAKEWQRLGRAKQTRPMKISRRPSLSAYIHHHWVWLRREYTCSSPSEDPGNNVLLIEAGPSDRSLFIQMPAALGIPLMKDRYNWKFFGANEDFHENQSDTGVYTPRGRVLGILLINGMNWVRGNRADYDGWCRHGLDDWSYAHCLPYFKRSEHTRRVMLHTEERVGNRGRKDRDQKSVISGLSERLF